MTRKRKECKLATVNKAIAIAKASKSRVDIYLACKHLAEYAKCSYARASKHLRDKTGLDVPDADEARKIASTLLYKGLFVTPTKGGEVRREDPRVAEYKALRIAVINLKDAEF